MIKRESKSSITFRHWLLANPIKHSCTFEMKQTIKNSISFGSVEERQADYARAIKHGHKGVLMRNVGGRGEPDYNYYYHAPAYIVVKFPDFFCIIDIDAWMNEAAQTKKRASLTAERARQIAYIIVDL